MKKLFIILSAALVLVFAGENKFEEREKLLEEWNQMICKNNLTEEVCNKIVSNCYSDEKDKI